MPGAAQLMLIGGVIHLDPAPAAFDAMIKGWKPQQMSRMLSASTIEPRLDLVRRFEKFVGTYPWSGILQMLRIGLPPFWVVTSREVIQPLEGTRTRYASFLNTLLIRVMAG